MMGCRQCAFMALVIILCSSLNTYAVHCLKEAVKARYGIHSCSSGTSEVETGGSENTLLDFFFPYCSEDSFRKKILKYFKVM